MQNIFIIVSIRIKENLSEQLQIYQNTLANLPGLYRWSFGQKIKFSVGAYIKERQRIYKNRVYRQIYNVQYSFINTFNHFAKNMSNAQVSLQNITFRQENTHSVMISLFTKLSYIEDPQKIQQLAHEIFSFITHADDNIFQTALQLITKMFSKGYANLIVQSQEVVHKIMKHFVVLFKRQDKQFTKELEYRKFFVLSVIAELIRQEPKYLVPFSRDFLLKFFEIEAENMESSGERNQLLAILGAIFGNLSKQPKLIKELKVGKAMKIAILNSYSCIEESSTFKQFNQAILQAQIKGAVVFTICELQRYKIKEMLIKTVSSHQTAHLQQYLEKIFPRSKENI